MLILDYSTSINMRKQRREGKEGVLDFRRSVIDSGFSPKAADEIWKWYDPANKKGIASY